MVKASGKKKRILAMAACCGILLLAMAILLIVILTRRGGSNRSSQVGISSGSSSPQSNWAEIAELEHYSTDQLRVFITPLMKIAGSAYNPSDLSPISQWQPSSKIPPLDPSSEAGARAVLYEEKTESRTATRLVLAFKGTSSQADSCVDRLLFGDVPNMGLPSPSSCSSSYTNASLDYISQGSNYTRSVLESYPGVPLLLTGHSLGGALAILVSASLAELQIQILPVVAFSSPGTKSVLSSRALNLDPQLKRQLIVIAHQWDPVVKAFWKDQIGTICLLQQGTQPPDCAACSAGNGSSYCSSCLFQTHGLNRITEMLQRGAKTDCADI